MSEDLRDNNEPQHVLPISAIVSVYGIMALLAYGLGHWLADRNVFVWAEVGADTSLATNIALGAGAGLVVVVISQVLDRLFVWARKLSDNLQRLIGELNDGRIIALATCSSLGEEMLFRGLLQPLLGIHLSSLIFGLLHNGPDRSYLPWTLMAIGMGYGFGALFLYTGNLLAPILAHFTINFFNLSALAKRQRLRSS